jgi:hypothetical protein
VGDVGLILLAGNGRMWRLVVNMVMNLTPVSSLPCPQHSVRGFLD